MFGLTRDFVRNGGVFMVLERPDGLRMDELSSVQVGMLASNRIARVLPVHIREVDLKVTLQYDIAGFKMLSHALKTEKIKLHVLYGLLFQIADTLLESRQYMLESCKFILQEDYLFVNGSLDQGGIGMIYVPIQDAAQTDIHQQFRELVIRLMAHVQQLQGEGIQRVLQLCHEESWDIRHLRELLLELYANGQKSEDDPEKTTASSVHPAAVSGMEAKLHVVSHGTHQGLESEPESFLFKRKGIMSSALETGQPQPFLPRSGERSAVESEKPSNHDSKKRMFKRSSVDSGEDQNLEPDVDDEGKDAGSAKVTYIALGCMVGMALIWRFIYMEQPGQMEMMVSSALSIILLGAAVWAWKGRGRFSFPALGKRQRESGGEEEMFQESWRWNNQAGHAGPFAARRSDDPSKLQDPLPGSDAAPEGPHLNTNVHRMDMPYNRRQGSMVQDLPHPHFSDKEQLQDSAASTENSMRFDVSREATVNLQSMKEAGGFKGADTGLPLYYLERRSPAGEPGERMDIRGASFVIGRSADMVQWVDAAVGVSRAHVELSRNKTGYAIKDLGSVNGTVLQGQLLAPYKEYPLHDGDSFILAESVYTYRAVQSV